MREEIMRLKTTGVPRLKRMAKEIGGCKSSIFVTLRKAFRRVTEMRPLKLTADKQATNLNYRSLMSRINV